MARTAIQIDVREAALRDVPAISAVHQRSDGPWVDPIECAVFMNHRLQRPYMDFLAIRDGDVVGHAEWILGPQADRAGVQLYLDMLQVRADCQHQGVGRALVEHGAALALQHGCDCVRTVPDAEAVGFYHKCGFVDAGLSPCCRLEVRTRPLPAGWHRERSVPRRAARELIMRLGLVQACSMHMWEIANRPLRMVVDEFVHPCARRADRRAYVQVRCRQSDEALVLAWADGDVALDELLDAAQHLASHHGVDRLLLAAREQEQARLPARAGRADAVPIMERALGGTG